MADAVSPEQNPGEGNERKCDTPVDCFGKFDDRRMEVTGDDRKQTVKKSPQNKGPVGTMPQTAAQKYDHDVQVGSQDTSAAAAQRDVYVSGEEPCQCFVPAVPKFRNGQCFVGGIKINGQIDVHHGTDADGHIAVSAEVKINLDGVGQCG